MDALRCCERSLRVALDVTSEEGFYKMHWKPSPPCPHSVYRPSLSKTSLLRGAMTGNGGSRMKYEAGEVNDASVSEDAEATHGVGGNISMKQM